LTNSQVDAQIPKILGKFASGGRTVLIYGPIWSWRY